MLCSGWIAFLGEACIDGGRQLIRNSVCRTWL